MFDSIPDEQIQQNMGISYQDQQAMRDPLAGLTLDTVPTADGGAGSGNFNHAGRPGEVGGSGGGGAYDKPTGKIMKASGQITLDKQERKRYDDLLLRTKTSNGETVNSVYGHFYDRAAERDFSPGEVRDCLTKATSIYPGNIGGRVVYQMGDMKVVFSPDTGEIVTVIKRDQS